MLFSFSLPCHEIIPRLRLVPVSFSLSGVYLYLDARYRFNSAGVVFFFSKGFICLNFPFLPGVGCPVVEREFTVCATTVAAKAAAIAQFPPAIVAKPKLANF